MKTKFSLLITVFLFTFLYSNSQGNYRNLNLKHQVATGTTVQPADFELVYSDILVTGKYAPAPYDIPGIDNSHGAFRIFIEDYYTGAMNFMKTYLIAGVDDISDIDDHFKYKVNEIKFDGTNYIVCGNITNSAISLNQAFVMKVDGGGYFMWFYSYDTPNSLSLEFNSIEPITSGGVQNGYVACGYRIDNNKIKRAIVTRIDSMGQPNAQMLQLNEPTVGTKYPESEYKRIIQFDSKTFALVGTCGVILDSCNRPSQSQVLFSMYDLPTDVIYGEYISTNPISTNDYRDDAGVSLVKKDSSLILLSSYMNLNSIPCSSSPDVLGNLIEIKPWNSKVVSSWQIIKSVKFNALQNAETDVPKDLLYDATTGHVWVYGNYNKDRGYLIKVNMTAAVSSGAPLTIPNNSGSSSIDGKTIMYNSNSNVIGLTDLNLDRYSIFEKINSSDSLCHSDSFHVVYIVDTLSSKVIHHDSLDAVSTYLEHVGYDITVDLDFLCDTVAGKHGLGSYGSSSQEIIVYPNPSTHEATFKIQSAFDCNGAYSITDLTGRIIQYKSLVLKRGDNYSLVDVSNLSNGIYFFTLQSKENTQTIKFRVTK